jgi:hypothetical protein
MARTSKRLFICLDNSGYEVSLERRKIYVALPDSKAARLGHFRIVDESGDSLPIPSQTLHSSGTAARHTPCRAARRLARLWTGRGVDNRSRLYRITAVGAHQHRSSESHLDKA